MRLGSAALLRDVATAETDDVRVPMTRSTLPLDVLEIIASFLGHESHFRTLANLNHVCRGARDVAQRTLWETLIIDNPEYEYIAALTDERIKTLDGFRHVKYIICSRALINPTTTTILLSRFPALVMTTSYDQRYTSPVPGSCAIHLHKPISTRTALGTVLAIPVKYARNDHAHCPKPSVKRSKSGFYAPCLQDMEKPRVRQLETISSLRCDEGAYLFDDESAEGWFTRIRTHPVRWPYFEPMVVTSAGDVGTVIELLKIPERHEDPGFIREVDAQLFRELRVTVGRRQPCQGKEAYDSRTWEFEATLEGMILFVDRFEQLAPSHPGLLLNRIKLFLLGSHPTPVLSALLDRFKQTYVDNVTSNAQVMPYDPRPPPAFVFLLTLAMYEGAVGNVMVCETEEGPVFDVMVTEDPGVWYVRRDVRRGEDAFVRI